MEFNAENMERVVTLFYNSDAQQQTQAHQWLTAAQNSPQAWSFVWELLSPHKSSEVQFFAATTLHSKLMKYWNEVPVDHYEPLKKRLLEAIISYVTGPKIVLNRLCIALSAYVIHTVPTYWAKPFEELVSSFQPHHLPNVEPERVIWILLEILTVIPEEFHSTTLHTSQRARVRTALYDVSKDILKVVEMCLLPIPAQGFDMSNLTTYMNAARCACSWVVLGGLNIEECSSLMLVLIDMACYVYWNKSDPEFLMGDEMDLIEMIMSALGAIIQHQSSHKYKTSVSKYAALMLYKFDKILQTERNLRDMNKDLVNSLYNLIVTIGDTHSKIFIENLKNESQDIRQLSLDLLTCILSCTNLPGIYPVDETSSTLTFGFWYTLQDDIIAIENTGEGAQLLLMVKPFYRDLVCIMLRKSMYPAVDDNCWSLDDKEVFRCYRQDIADTFMYCYVVLNMEMLDILNTKLHEALRKDESNGSAPHQIQWNELETVLHAFGAIAESVEYENLYLPKLMALIKTIPFHDLNVKVMATALETIGSYSEWFVDHNDAIESVLPLILSTLRNPEVAMHSSLALKDICHNCQRHLAPYANHILMATQEAMQSGALKLQEHKRLMYCTGRVMSVLPLNKIMSYLNMILAPSIDELQKLANSEPSKTLAVSIATRLKIVGALFNSLHVEAAPNTEQPLFMVIQNTMSLYRTISEKYYDNYEVMEDLSLVFKYTITTLKDDCKPLLNDILNIIVRVYRQCSNSHILFVVKTVILLFGPMEQCRQMNSQLLHEIVNSTLAVCHLYHSKNQLSDKADVIDSFFVLLSNIIKKMPQLITGCGIDTSALFSCGIICLVLPEVAALKAVASYLVNFINMSRETSQAEVVQNNGERLILRILMSLGTAPRTSAEIYADIFLILNKKYCDNLSRWLNTILSQQGVPSPRVSNHQKEMFVKSILREKSNKRRVCDLVLEFMLLCKGIPKPEMNQG